MTLNITPKTFKKILMAFMIVFTIIFFVTLFSDHWFMRVTCPLLSMAGNVFCGFSFGYVLGDNKNND